MILAEPTAAIDPNAEHDLYDQFSKLSAHKTVLFITHRLASVTMADRVLFIAKGDSNMKGATLPRCFLRIGEVV